MKILDALRLCYLCHSWIGHERLICKKCLTQQFAGVVPKSITIGEHLECYYLMDWSDSCRLPGDFVKQFKGGMFYLTVLDVLLQFPDLILKIGADIALPVPAKSIHRNKDHAYNIARAWAGLSGCILKNELSIITPDSQRGKNKIERAEIQMKRTRSKPFNGKLVILDDVTTTGSTLLAASDCYPEVKTKTAFVMVYKHERIADA